MRVTIFGLSETSLYTYSLIRMLFTSRAAWQAAQQECPDLRRTHFHQGTRPFKKAKKNRGRRRFCIRWFPYCEGLSTIPTQP